MKNYNVVLNGEKFDVTVEAITDEQAEKLLSQKLENDSKHEMMLDAVGCPQTNTIENKMDSSSFGWSFVGFCIPIVGLILYLIWKDEMPLRAKSAGKGALTKVITTVLIYILLLAIVMD